VRDYVHFPDALETVGICTIMVVID